MSSAVVYKSPSSFAPIRKARTSRLIWVDFAKNRQEPSSISKFEDFFHVRPMVIEQAQLGSFQCNEYACMVFELDYPDLDSLQAISICRYKNPDIPIILVAVEHSEELVLWALRNRIWDFYYKPLDADSIADICSNVQMLVDSKKSDLLNQMSVPLVNAAASPKTFAQYNKRHEKRVVDLALNYIKKNISEKIGAADVAKECGVTYFHFRAIFQKETRKTFQEYLLEYRIEQAKQRLQHKGSNIACISYEVGFQDPSYFTRVFRRIVGDSPTVYRSQFRKAG